MKLFYMPGACSLAPHIIARELGLDIAIEKVDTKAGKTASGADFRAINPKGYVPTLQLDGGEVLTEAAVIIQYLADQKPDAKLMPAAGTMERYRTQEWLNYVATELHKGIGTLFNKSWDDNARKVASGALPAKFAFLDQQLQGKSYLQGEQFTAPDAYLFTTLSWARHLKVDLSAYPNVTAYWERVAARPAVQAALKAEGIAK